MPPEIHTISLPPEDYPAQKDYGELILILNSQSRNLHKAFLHDHLDIAQTDAANLFNTAAELLKLASVLLIERNNHAQEHRNKTRLQASTVKGEIRSTAARVSATAQEWHERQREKQQLTNTQDRIWNKNRENLGDGEN